MADPQATSDRAAKQCPASIRYETWRGDVLEPVGGDVRCVLNASHKGVHQSGDGVTWTLPYPPERSP